jgi:hypothetical protein
VQLELESDVAVSDQKQSQLEEDLYAITEIEQQLLDTFPPNDGYLLDNAHDMDTWVVPTSQPYLHVLAHLQNIAVMQLTLCLEFQSQVWSGYLHQISATATATGHGFPAPVNNWTKPRTTGHHQLWAQPQWS